MAGKIVVSIKVAPDGSIVSVSKVGGSGLSADVERCMLFRVGMATFEPPGGIGSTIQVPILFVRQGAPSDASVAD